MTDSRDMFIFLLLAFLVGTGAVSILAAIYQVMNPPEKAQGDPTNSSVETKWFKLNAPTGFVYGLVAILVVVAVVKFDQNRELKDGLQASNQTVADLRREMEKLRVRLDSQEGSRAVPDRFEVKVSSREPTSLFDGSVLALFSRNSFSPDTLEFKGGGGTGRDMASSFAIGPTPIKQGDRLFMKTARGTLWGVNVLRDDDPLLLEFYRPGESKR